MFSPFAPPPLVVALRLSRQGFMETKTKTDPRLAGGQTERGRPE